MAICAKRDGRAIVCFFVDPKFRTRLHAGNLGRQTCISAFEQAHFRPDGSANTKPWNAKRNGVLQPRPGHAANVGCNLPKTTQFTDSRIGQVEVFLFFQSFWGFTKS
jgi:hypothetical protein